MLQKVKEFIRQNNLIKNNDKVIIALSGGADSIALLDILYRLKYNCLAAHCNFHLRGEESNRDAEFVKQFCANYNVPLSIIDFNTEEYARTNSISIEMAARELRYNWFEQIRKQYKADFIAVAHHQDDSVETILLNLIRGTGIRGLTGIPVRNNFVIRPLLGVTRKDIIKYINGRKLSYVEDYTNKEDIYVRNKIRLNILPLLETINPSAKSSIIRTAEHLSQVENIYSCYVNEIRSKVLNNNEIDIQKLLNCTEPQAILFELLYSYGFNSATIEQIFKSLSAQSGKIFYSEKYKVIKDRYTLILAPKENLHDAVYTINKSDCEINKPIQLRIKYIDNEIFKFKKDSNILYLDADKITFPIILRKWKVGDWFIPFGMKGRKKVSDYFSDNKFSLIDKENTWLLCNDTDIIWIVGHRSDNRYRINQNTKKILQIKFLGY